MKKNCNRNVSFKKRALCIFAGSLLILPGSLNAETYRSHQVRKGETLSEVLYLYNLTPIYGRNGQLAKALVLNPHLKSSHGNFIRPFTWIRLPIATEEAPLSAIEESRSVSSEPISVSVPEERSENSAKAFSLWEVEGGFSYLALHGVDPIDGTRGDLLSEVSPSVAVRWKQVWSESFRSSLFLKLQSYQIEPEASGLTLDKAQGALSSFGLGVESDLTSRLLAKVDIAFSQTLFYRGLSGGGLEIFKTPLLKLAPQVEYVFLEKQPFAFSVLGGGSVLFPSSYDSVTIDGGYEFEGALKITQLVREKTHFYCKLGYRERHQNMSILDLIEKEMGGFCGLSWEAFRD
ncbi:MAG: hypothetical protein AAGB31_11915 [Bdellovibrio sp.]